MRSLFVIAAILGCLAWVESRPNRGSSLFDDSEEFCGYNKCQKPHPDKLNIHIVPHTHDDVGWLKTVDQYYYGNKQGIQYAGVGYIIDSVVQDLLRDPKKKFVYVESAFFSKWWKRQSARLQDEVKKLVKEGRLEFIGGAWSMNDEAAVHYNSIIDQFSWGLKFLTDTFGKCGRPKIGWQIDPFGHAREMASMFGQMGYDGMFFARLDWQDKGVRLENKTAEMIWHGSANLDPKYSDLFTGVLYNHYSPPPGFCFDILCSDEPMIDELDSEDYNIPRRVDEFVNYAKNQSLGYRHNHAMYTMGGDFTFMDANVYYSNLDKIIREFVTKMSERYRTNNLLITMGDDFHYMDANTWFSNLDKLLKYSNEMYGEEINMFYSTPTCYLKALHDANITWPEKSDDFFPYASDPHTYWVGYFTSRPTQKRYERTGNHFLQVCKQLVARSPVSHSFFPKNLDRLREMMGIWQHHDAITGTEKQHVANDYALLMHKAMRGCEQNAAAAIREIHGGAVDHKICLYLNVSQCEVTESEAPVQVVTLYNPNANNRRSLVRVPVTLPDRYRLIDETRSEVEYQVVPIPDSVESVFERSSAARYEIVFMPPTPLAPFEMRSYILHIVPKAEMPLSTSWQEPRGDFSIRNEHLEVFFRDGELYKIAGIGATKFEQNIRQHYMWYEGAVGDNYAFENRSSGAYIFRPNNTARILLPTKTEFINGSLVQEVHQVFNDWCSQVVRLRTGARHVEFEWLVKEIPIDDDLGKEIVSRFVTNIKSRQTFYTDSNGREMLERKLNFRPSWNVSIVEPEAGNYYPVTAKIAIQDDDFRLAVLNDRAQGGSSLQDGIVELMVHRRLLKDDAFGVGEALNETAEARGTHYLVFSPRSSEHPTPEAYERVLQAEILTPPWPFFASADAVPVFDSSNDVFMPKPLPDNVRLMTFEPWGTSSEPTYLVRFEHLFEKNEDPKLSKPVSLDLQDFFGDLDFEFRETTLDGNQWLDEAERRNFTPDDAEFDAPRFVKLKKEVDGTTFTLGPMEIRTFVVRFITSDDEL